MTARAGWSDSAATGVINRYAKPALGRLNRMADSRLLRPQLPPSSRPRVKLVAVYRARNVHYLQALLDAAGEVDLQVALWSLDDVAPALAARTIGSGPGTKLALVNRLLADDGDDADWIVAADDDVTLAKGTLRDLVDLMRAAELDLAMPAHAQGSSWHHFITLARPRTRARLTTFVEVGPIFVLSRAGAKVQLPLPEELGMGWGVEAIWRRNAEEAGQRLGIVDDVRVRHHGKIGIAYDSAAAQAAEKALYRTLGLPPEPVTETIHRWPAWRRLPPWPVAG